MPFTKGTSGNSKGRRKGSLGKDKQALRDRLAEKFPGWDPVEAMAKVANDKSADPATRFQACKEVAQYIHPKLKSIEVSGELKSTIVRFVDADDPTP